MLNFRTDLASERRDLYKKANNNEEFSCITSFVCANLFWWAGKLLLLLHRLHLLALSLLCGHMFLLGLSYVLLQLLCFLYLLVFVKCLLVCEHLLCEVLLLVRLKYIMFFLSLFLIALLQVLLFVLLLLIMLLMVVRSFIYPSPTSYNVCILFFILGNFSKNFSASSTVISNTSAMFFPLYLTSRVSRLYLFPLHTSHGT